jgi:hypothetical protein
MAIARIEWADLSVEEACDSGLFAGANAGRRFA